jgi:hypothetical protein
MQKILVATPTGYDKMIRLVNPIILLEHGMQSDNVNISSLLCVMALDMLFRAGQINPFVKRLGGFLGPSSFVLPPDSIWECQPSPLLDDVIRDVYEFRNIIAHGQRIPSTPYLQPYELTCTNGLRVNDTKYRYDQLLQESARFITAALRKIFIDGLLDDVKDDDKWGFEMNRYERRY